MNDNRQKLREYVRGVVQGMIERGIIRRERGEGWEDVARREAEIVGREVWNDVKVVMIELGIGARVGLEAAARSKAADLASAGLEKLFEAAFTPRERRK